MNPDTKATTKLLKIICARHNIPYHSHSRITTGFNHEVHRLNHDLVVKFFNSEDSRSFKTESAVLSSNLPFLKPKLITIGKKNDVINRNYVIMSYVKGVSLGNRWHLATGKQREEFIKTICHSLKIINKLDSTYIGLKKISSWEDSIREHIEILASQLQNKNIIDVSSADRARKTVQNNAKVLADSKLYPVYWDIHFDNFIVDENFKLQAFIDLENIELTPLDYPLVFVQKMMNEPEKYLREEDEKLADKKDYAKLNELYKKYYPEMFNFANLKTRIKLYLLLDTLHLLTNWSHIKELHEKLDMLTVE